MAKREHAAPGSGRSTAWGCSAWVWFWQQADSFWAYVFVLVRASSGRPGWSTTCSRPCTADPAARPSTVVVAVVCQRRRDAAPHGSAGRTGGPAGQVRCRRGCHLLPTPWASARQRPRPGRARPRGRPPVEQRGRRSGARAPPPSRPRRPPRPRPRRRRPRPPPSPTGWWPAGPTRLGDAALAQSLVDGLGSRGGGAFEALVGLDAVFTDPLVAMAPTDRARRRVGSLVVCAFGNRVAGDGTLGPGRSAGPRPGSRDFGRAPRPRVRPVGVADLLAETGWATSSIDPTPVPTAGSYLSTAGVAEKAVTLAQQRGVDLGQVGVIGFQDHGPLRAHQPGAGMTDAAVPERASTSRAPTTPSPARVDPRLADLPPDRPPGPPPRRPTGLGGSTSPGIVGDHPAGDPVAPPPGRARPGGMRS